MATTYGLRPSQFFRLETDLAAWQLDEACFITGAECEAEISKGNNPFGGFTISGQPSNGKYASAPKQLIRKVKIKPDGTW